MNRQYLAEALVFFLRHTTFFFTSRTALGQLLARLPLLRENVTSVGIQDTLNTGDSSVAFAAIANSCRRLVSVHIILLGERRGYPGWQEKLGWQETPQLHSAVDQFKKIRGLKSFKLSGEYYDQPAYLLRRRSLRSVEKEIRECVLETEV